MDYKVLGYSLDRQQEEIIVNNDKYLLVIAGAGSGKTLTIVGKIKYLINELNINQKDILCLSFSNESVNSLKNKIYAEVNKKIDILTFHKLAVNVLNSCNFKYKISKEDTLYNIIYEFFYIDILNNKYFKMKVLFLFDIYSNIDKNYFHFLNSNKFNNFIKLINAFIKLMKCNNKNINEFISYHKKIKSIFNILNYRKEKIILEIIFNIYLKYYNFLKEEYELDFDDLITYATEYINKSDINYKYIIIDEFQDTSLARLNLVKEIIKKCDSKLMVVGDDFQSIYKFSGCNLDIFINFNKYFKNTKILKIENTYRNSQQLIDIAGKFIKKNKKQINKNLKSQKNLNNPIHIIYYKNIILELKNIIDNIYLKYKKIMIIGRNNNDINMLIDNHYFLKEKNKIIYSLKKEISIYFLTAHKSKGLEEDCVFIINLTSNINGFPSNIKNDKILRLINNTHEEFLFAEERRLFYVALTRTKNEVFLFVPYTNKSIFISEIEKYIKKNTKKYFIH